MSFKEEILCEDYNGYYLVDEQCVRINRPNSDKHNFVQTIIANNSIWKIQFQWDSNYLSYIWLNLTTFPWTPLEYAAEFVVFGKNGYNEHIIEKKRFVFKCKIETLGELIWQSSYQLSTELTIRNMETKNGIQPNQRINNVGIIIRILKSRSATNDSKVEIEEESQYFLITPEKQRHPPAYKEFVVNERSFFLNVEHLSALSPHFSTMFQSDFKERNSEKVELKEITSATDFEEILTLISQQMLPNPANVQAISELADRYCFENARELCERHLMNCVEISIPERYFFASRHRFAGLRAYILALMDSPTLSKFYIDNKANIDAEKQLLVELLNEHIKYRVDGQKMLINFYNLSKEEIDKKESLLISLLMAIAKSHGLC